MSFRAHGWSGQDIFSPGFCRLSSILVHTLDFFLNAIGKKPLHLELAFRLQNPSNNSICISTTFSDMESIIEELDGLFVGVAGTELLLKGCAS